MKKCLFGVAYGIGLVMLGVMLAGGGHGTSLMLDVASAPLGFIVPWTTLLGPPIIWGFIWWMLAQPKASSLRKPVPYVLALHYLSLLAIPYVNLYDENAYLRKVFSLYPTTVIVSVLYYLFGQLLAWYFWFRPSKNGEYR